MTSRRSCCSSFEACSDVMDCDCFIWSLPTLALPKFSCPPVVVALAVVAASLPFPVPVPVPFALGFPRDPRRFFLRELLRLLLADLVVSPAALFGGVAGTAKTPSNFKGFVVVVVASVGGTPVPVPVPSPIPRFHLVSWPLFQSLGCLSSLLQLSSPILGLPFVFLWHFHCSPAYLVAIFRCM